MQRGESKYEFNLESLNMNHGVEVYQVQNFVIILLVTNSHGVHLLPLEM